jgi:hypothetical protein
VSRLAFLAIVCGLLSAPLPATVAPPAGPFDGTWTLTPAFTTTCSAGAVSVDVTVGRVFTRQTDPDSLEIRSDVVVSGLGMTHLDIYTLKVHIDSAERTLRFSGPVKGSVQRQEYSGMLSGRLRVGGAFVDPDRIRAQVRTALSISVTTPGGVSSGLCAPFDATIIATRAPE